MFIFGFIIFYIILCIMMIFNDVYSKEEKTTIIISYSILFILLIFGVYIVLNK